MPSSSKRFDWRKSSRTASKSQLDISGVARQSAADALAAAGFTAEGTIDDVYPDSLLLINLSRLDKEPQKRGTMELTHLLLLTKSVWADQPMCFRVRRAFGENAWGMHVP